MAEIIGWKVTYYNQNGLYVEEKFSADPFEQIKAQNRQIELRRLRRRQVTDKVEHPISEAQLGHIYGIGLPKAVNSEEATTSANGTGKGRRRDWRERD